MGSKLDFQATSLPNATKNWKRREMSNQGSLVFSPCFDFFNLTTLIKFLKPSRGRGKIAKCKRTKKFVIYVKFM